MAYTPNPLDVTQPTTDKFVETAAAEFRALKQSVVGLQAALAADSTLFLGAWSAQTGAAVLGNIVIHNSAAWMALAPIADITLAEPGVSALWLSMGAYRSPFDNLVLNGNFARNVRAKSGIIVLTAGQLGHDMWYAGAGGCTYTVAGGVATITAGTLKTAVWGQRIVTADHTASHSGTAPFSVNGGASTAAAKTVALVAGANCVLEFGIGTVREVSLCLGKTALPFLPYSPELQAVLVDYYVRKHFVLLGNNAATAWTTGFGGTSAQLHLAGRSMRAPPGLSWLDNANIQYYGFAGLWTGSALSGAAYGVADGMTLLVTAIADGDGRGKLLRKTTAGDVYAILSAELTP